MTRPPERSSLLQNIAVVAIIVAVVAFAVFGLVAALDGTIAIYTPPHNIDR